MIKLKAVSDNFGQFWTVLGKMLWYRVIPLYSTLGIMVLAYVML